MKKNILLILLFSILFVVLVLFFYKIQPENIYLPSSITFFMFGNILKLLYNTNEKKRERFLPIGKVNMINAYILGAIVFLLFVVIIGITSNKNDSWMGVGFTVFYGTGFLLAMLLFYQPYIFAFRNKKIVFNRIMPFVKKIYYKDIQQISIESEKIIFIKNDSTQKSCEIKLTEEEKNRVIHFLAKKDINIVL